MKFKSGAQRKAVMAKLKSVNNRDFRALAKAGHKTGLITGTEKFKIMNHDTDGDGVKNKDDCRPFDPKKQGALHDWNIKRLKKQEEKLETQREKVMKKLEDSKDTLKVKMAIATKKGNIKSLQLKQKQAIIDEINTEKAKIVELKRANQEAKRQLDSLTLSGKAKTAFKKGVTGAGNKFVKGSFIVGDATEAFFKKKSTRRVLKNIGKALT